MRTRRGLALALLLSLSQLAATVKAAPNQPPTFEIVFPNHSYTQPIASMLEFDIRNQSLDLFDAEGKTTTAARLHNGTFEERHADGSYTNINVTVQYFDFYNEHPNHALATMKWMTSGPSTTSSIGLLQVFEIRSGRAVVTQQIRFNRLADGAGSSFDPETLRLTIKGVHGGDHGTPIIDTGKFFWDGKKFALLKKQPAARP